MSKPTSATKPFWNKQKALAAELKAEGKSRKEIAETVGVPQARIQYWGTQDYFEARVQEIVTQFAQQLEKRGLLQKLRRLEAKANRWDGGNRIIQERGEDPAMANVPGGKTGLLTRQLKALKTGPRDYEIVEEYKLDNALMAELRELEREAAIELGQWTEKKEVETTNTTTISQEVEHRHTIDLERLPLELKRQLLQYVRDSKKEQDETKLIENVASDPMTAINETNV